MAGGDADPNLASLLRLLEAERVPHLAILAGASTHPRLSWDLERDALRFNGRTIAPPALFIRHDVFTNLEDNRPQSAARAYAWFAAVAGWAQAHATVRILNRHHSWQLLKPQQLVMARAAGLAVPSTRITNDLASLGDGRGLVVKPVTGGDYCQPLEPVLARTEQRNGAAASPAIVQERLVPPELRVYRVGRRFLSFEIASDALDYRATQNVRVTPAKNDRTLVSRLRKVMNAMRLDFGAADFKTSPKTGQLQFLEVNSSPMFAAFDAVSGDAVSRAIVAALTE